MQFRTTSAEATREVAAALEPLLRPGDVVLLSGDLGAGKTVFTQGLAAALGVTEQVTSPTFTLAQSFQGRIRLHHLDVYRLDSLGEVLDLDLPELLDDDAVVCVEWGEVIIPELPRDFLRVRISLASPNRALGHPHVRRRYRRSQLAGTRRRARRGVEHARPFGRRDVLVLGIETATPQVGVAIGGHEGIIASFHTTRDRRHAETLVPAIQFLCEQAQMKLSQLGLVAVDIGPGLFTGLRVGLATAKAIAHACRIPMIGVSSLDLTAFPARFSDRLIVSTVDARRGEIFYATYRRAPGGIQLLSPPAVDQPADVAGQLMALGQETLIVGDGAQRYADELGAVRGAEIGREGLRHPNAGALVELAHARALREEFVSPSEIVPLYLRAPDVRINWQQRERS